MLIEILFLLTEVNFVVIIVVVACMDMVRETKTFCEFLLGFV